MHQHKICIRCGNPVRVSRDKYEFYDRMHWICYHLEFEHSEYDPDEPCEDPNCPWNRIHDVKKMSLWDPIWSISVYSSDRRSVFRIRVLEQYPGGEIDLTAEVEDMGIHKQVDFSVGGRSWEEFIVAFIELDKPEPREAVLRSISPGVMEMRIEKHQNGQMVLSYSLQEESGPNGSPGFTVTSGFQIDPAGFSLAIKSFLDL
ncbi:MAG: hypothetical protein ACM3PE_11225 [Deltaproteobacteria bacterium]